MFLRLPFPHWPAVVFGLLLLGATACGNDLSDGDFGGVDLKPFFGDTSLRAKDPPRSISTRLHKGYLDEGKVLYMDFGWSASIKDTPDEGRRAELSLPEGFDDKIPKVAPVNPMYFFFDSKGNPMFSAPVLEKKTGNFTISGGRNLLNPNPRDDAARKIAYPVRSRDALKDPLRNVADYQRPIVDVIIDRDKSDNLQRYSGLWEFVKVTAPAGYKPDEIKSWATLEQGVAAGDFKITASRIDVKQKTELLAINCPLVDSRTLVLPYVSAYSNTESRIPQPRVELWYRKKRIDCSLVNGWETLGKTTAGTNGIDQYTLYKSSEDELRVGVLDTDVISLGVGVGEKRQIVSPVGQLFIPRVTARTEDYYFNDIFLTTGSFPRRTRGDAPGYRPVRWWWNIEVTDYGEDFSEKLFLAAKLDDVRRIDDSKLTPREGITLNFPLAGVELACPMATSEDNDPCVKFGLVCGKLQDGTVPTCEKRKVRYGEACAPTIAECRNVLNEKPTVDLVEQWFTKGVIPPNPEALSGIPDKWLEAQADGKARGRLIVALNSGGIYSCLTQGTTEVGSCYLSCDGNQVNQLQGTSMKETLEVGAGKEIKVEFALDSRCGGALMPGFRCLPITNESVEKGGQRCMRDCNPGQGEDYNNAVCQRPTPAYLSNNLINFDIAKNTACRSINRLNGEDPTIVEGTYGACIRDQAFAPFPEN